MTIPPYVIPLIPLPIYVFAMWMQTRFHKQYRELTGQMIIQLRETNTELLSHLQSTATDDEQTTIPTTGNTAELALYLEADRARFNEMGWDFHEENGQFLFPGYGEDGNIDRLILHLQHRELPVETTPSSALVSRRIRP